MVRQNHGRPHGGQNGHLSSQLEIGRTNARFPAERTNARLSSQLEIGTKNQNFLENVTSAAQFRLIDLFIAMTVY